MHRNLGSNGHDPPPLMISSQFNPKAACLRLCEYESTVAYEVTKGIHSCMFLQQRNMFPRCVGLVNGRIWTINYIEDCLIGSGSLLKSNWVLALQLIVDQTLRAMLASGSSGSNAYVPGTGHHRIDVHRVKEFPS